MTATQTLDTTAAPPKVNRGKKRHIKHSDFLCPIDIDRLIESMREYACDEVGKAADDYLRDLSDSDRDELRKIITKFLDAKAKINF